MIDSAVGRNALEGERGLDQMDMVGMLETMRQALTRRFGIEGGLVTEDQPIALLGLDSLAFIEYSFELEKELGVTLPDLPRDLVTVGDLAQFVHAEVRRQANANAANDAAARASGT